MKKSPESRWWIAELAVVFLLTGLVTYLTVFVSLYQMRALEHLHGTVEKLPFLTRIAAGANVWGPVVFGGAAILMLALRIRRPDQRWLTFAVFAAVCLIAVLIATALILPFARTTFRLSS